MLIKNNNNNNSNSNNNDTKMSYIVTVSNNDQINTSSAQYGNHLVKAQLPNHQRTTVSIPAGMTIREALGKALKLRKLEPDMCLVYRLCPQSQTKQRIDWDVDVAMLKGDEVIVETKDRVPMHTQLSHNFAKCYFSRCHFCPLRIVIGFRCLTCRTEFHDKCFRLLPKLCEPAIEHSNYYKHLLARSNGFSPTNNISNSESPTNTNRPIRPRARSADENSKHKSRTINQSNQATTVQQQLAVANGNINNNNNNHNNNYYYYNNNVGNSNNANNDYQQYESQTLSIISSSQYQTNGTSPSSNHHLQPHYHSNVHSVLFNTSTGNNNNHSNISKESTSTAQHPSPSTPKEFHLQQSPSSQQTSNRELLEERWEIDGDEIERGPRIGQGSFATVYKGKWHGPVALKELNVKDPTPAQLQDFKNEVVVLKKTRHPNVLLFVGYVLKPELIIVTQWCKGRSLYKHLHVEDRREFTNCEIKNIAIGVAQGMEYLHAKNILHRDLKSNNIFIHDEDDLTVRIGDFGLATFKTRWEGNQQIYHPTGSILWMAPEVIRTKPGVNPFTFQSDVYSYGIVLYELISRKLPYFDFKHKDALLFLIGLGDPKSAPKLNLDVIGPDKPNGLKALMLRCIERDPEQRPLFTSIIKDLKDIKLSNISRSTSEPLRLNDLNGSLALDTMNY